MKKLIFCGHQYLYTTDKILYHSYLDLITKNDDIYAFCVLLEKLYNIQSYCFDDYSDKNSKYYIILDALYNLNKIEIESIFKYLIKLYHSKNNKFYLKKLIYHEDFKYFRSNIFHDIKTLIKNNFGEYKIAYFLKIVDKKYLLIEKNFSNYYGYNEFKSFKLDIERCFLKYNKYHNKKIYFIKIILIKMHKI